MIQLILDTGGVALAMPESKNGGYYVDEFPLMEDVEMISGRVAREMRHGLVWKIDYQYGYLNEEEKNRFLTACKRGLSGSILCSFLPQESTELVTAKFLVTSYKRPKFMWSNTGNPLYGDYFVSLREVKPHHA